MPLNAKELDHLLNTEELAYIATTNADGTPHLMPIWFIYHNGKLYFETDNTTVKFKNIQRLNKVAVCIGGKNTYIINGSVKWFTEQELNFPIRKMFWDKYAKEMDDSYITKKTLLFEVVPKKTDSWHYAPNWD
ncbi:MAG: pyridoxamine 5'-phosphate oxidase family protein [bacterium]|nr:pyridoxamine 5'-phosphate oxidase family protein [bacterium]